MNDELLYYYEQELAYMHRLSREFAQAYPKIAGRLRLEKGRIQDPHVDHLIQAFALLTARISCKLDDDFSQISDALLNTLYPHYQLPIPSVSVVQLQYSANLKNNYLLPAGEIVETDPIHGQPCYFKTAYPVELWPLEIANATLSCQPFVAPKLPNIKNALSVLQLDILCTEKEATFAKLTPHKLRFYLNAPEQFVYKLYELIFNNTIAIALAKSPNDPDAIFLNKAQLTPVGFNDDEGLLPYPSRSSLSYRLLTEFFAFPKKFLFFDLNGLEIDQLKNVEKSLSIFFYFNHNATELEKEISAEYFNLGCTPIINLFERTAEPINVTHTMTEYRVTPDARRPQDIDIYMIRKVSSINDEGQKIEYLPFYSVDHTGVSQNLWHATRRATRDNQNQLGTEMYLSLSDLNFNPLDINHQTIIVEAIFSNKDLPSRLPFGNNQPRLRLKTNVAAIESINCLSPMSSPLEPNLTKDNRWQLISQLSLNYLSLSKDPNSLSALKEILSLYDLTNSEITQAMINGIVSMQTNPITKRIKTDLGIALCTGTEVTLEFDENNYVGSGLFLFAAVLERFLSCYCSINSFCQLVIVTTQNPHRELHRWQPRVGNQALL